VLSYAEFDAPVIASAIFHHTVTAAFYCPIFAGQRMGTDITLRTQHGGINPGMNEGSANSIAHQIDPLLNPPWVGLLNAWRGGFFAPGFDCVDPARNEIVTGSKGRQGVGPSLAQLPKHGKRPRVTISLNAASPGDIPFACITAAVISAEVSGLDAIRRASCVRRDSSLRAK
jgi:hypothetical protein